MKRWMYYRIFTAVSLSICAMILLSSSAHAQDDRALLEKMVKDDSEAVNVIALYDNDVRTSLFIAAGSPEVVARLSDAQKLSNESFRKAISAYSKEDQGRIWNLTRFNGLISRLQQSPPHDLASIDAILRDYPEEVHADARAISTTHPEVLASVDMVRREFERSSTLTLATYPENVRHAFELLMKNPEALGTLNENMRMSVVLGDLYKRNPDMVQARFRELNLALVNRKAKDLEDWKAQMAANPDAQSELKQSARDFADAQGYPASSYTDTRPVVVEHYVSVPYAYWSGYPYWYEAPCWTPYPYWYHWGFYYSSGNVVWWGTPSWYFLNWHFHHRAHFSMYPHITNCYFDYFYYGPSRYYARSSWYCHQWYDGHRQHFPDDFRDNRGQRIERIRDLSTSIGQRRSGTVSSPNGSTGTGSGQRRNTVDRPGTAGTGSSHGVPVQTPNRSPFSDPVRPNTTPSPSPRQTPVEQPHSNPRTSSPSTTPSSPSRDVPRVVHPPVERANPNPAPRGGGSAVPKLESHSAPASPRPSSGPNTSPRSNSHP